MTFPNISIHDGLTGKIVEREMTEEEYQALLASGWALEPKESPTDSE